MKKILSGNEAVARGVWESGCQFASAYPGTPSTEILENVSKYKEDVYCEWTANEKTAVERSIGASFAGSRAICAMKHVGVNVAADPLFSFSYIGPKGGFIIVSADDPSMHSSQNEQDNRIYSKFSKIACLEPSDSQDCKDYIKKGFELSEKFGTAVMLRMTTRICHSKSIVELNDRKEVAIKEYKRDIAKNVIIPSTAYKLHKVVEKRLEDLKEYGYSTDLNRIEYNDKVVSIKELPKSEIGIITSGISYQYSKEIFPEASVLKLGLVNPLPDKLIKEFSEKVKTLYIIEELEPFIEEQVRAMGIKCIGKDKLPNTYEFNLNVVENSLKGINTATEINESELVNPPRPPALCPGCPHRGVFYTLKKLNADVTGDIGCYTLGCVPPLSALHTCVCMGASITVAGGMDKVFSNNEKSSKLVACIGDSTFFHSGITGLIDLVYNKGSVTVNVMDNSITAMTGHQNNPGTGKTLNGEISNSVNIAKLAEACGVNKDNVKEVSAFNLKKLKETFSNELDKNNPSVVVTKGPCIFVDPKLKKGPKVKFKINNEKCVKCGSCFQVGCPAIAKDENGYPVINSLLCMGCSVCSQTCSVKAIFPEKSE